MDAQTEPRIHPRELDAAAPVPAGYAVVDVREQHEWDAGRIADALHIPLGELPARLAELPEADLLMVCRSGRRSERATQWLNLNGYDAVNLEGGLLAWHALGLPLTADGSAPRVV